MSETSKALAFIESEIRFLLPFTGTKYSDRQPGIGYRVFQLDMRIKQFRKDLLGEARSLKQEQLHAHFIPFWRRVEELIDLVTGLDGEGSLMMPGRLMGKLPEPEEWEERIKLYRTLTDVTGYLWLDEYYEPDEPLEGFYRAEKATLFDRQVKRLEGRLADLGISPVLIHLAFKPYREFRDHPEVTFSYRQLTKLRRMMIEMAWWTEMETNGYADGQFIWLLASLHLNSKQFIKYCRGWYFRQIVEQPFFDRQLEVVERLRSFVDSFESYDWCVYTDEPDIKYELRDWLREEQQFLNAKLEEDGPFQMPIDASVAEIACMIREIFGKDTKASGISPEGVARMVCAYFTSEGIPIPFKQFLKSYLFTDPSIDSQTIKRYRDVLTQSKLLGGFGEFLN